MKPSATPAHAALPPYAAQAAWRALIQRSVDLRELYQKSLQTCEPGVRTVLEDNAQTLHILIGELQAHTGSEGGQIRHQGSWRGTARRQFSGWLIGAMARQDRPWLRVLARQGNELLESFEGSIAELPNESARVLCRQLPRLQGICQDMDCLVGSAS
ncbi:MAG: hypothetical protein ABI178_06715 [Rhodanobacter sp.]